MNKKELLWNALGLLACVASFIYQEHSMQTKVQKVVAEEMAKKGGKQ